MSDCQKKTGGGWEVVDGEERRGSTRGKACGSTCETTCQIACGIACGSTCKGDGWTGGGSGGIAFECNSGFFFGSLTPYFLRATGRGKRASRATCIISKLSPWNIVEKTQVVQTEREQVWTNSRLFLPETISLTVLEKLRKSCLGGLSKS